MGAFSESPGPYGTFDMGGDVLQWNEANVDGWRARGGCWGGSLSTDMKSSFRGDFTWSDQSLCRLSRGRADRFGQCQRDGKVDINDLTIVLSHFGQTGMTWSQGEFTGDGRVDVNDLTIVLANFGQSPGSSAAAAAVPEPGTWAFLAVGLPGLDRLCLAEAKMTVEVQPPASQRRDLPGRGGWTSGRTSSVAGSGCRPRRWHWRPRFGIRPVRQRDKVYWAC